MKIALFATLLAVLALTANVQSAIPHREMSQLAGSKTNAASCPDFGTAFKMFCDGFKKIMPCGYPAVNIPVLAPFTLDVFRISMSNDYAALNGVLSNVIVTGMNDNHFNEYTWDADTNNVTYDIIFPQLQFFSEYNVTSWANIAGLSFNFDGQGALDIKIKDLHLMGTIALGQSLDNPNTLAISDFKLYLYVGDAIFNNWNHLWDNASNNFSNLLMRQFLPMWVEQFEAQVNQMYVKDVMPTIDRILEFTSMPQLINIIQQWTADLNNANCTLV